MRGGAGRGGAELEARSARRRPSRVWMGNSKSSGHHEASAVPKSARRRRPDGPRKMSRFASSAGWRELNLIVLMKIKGLWSCSLAPGGRR